MTALTGRKNSKYFATLANCDNILGKDEDVMNWQVFGCFMALI